MIRLGFYEALHFVLLLKWEAALLILVGTFILIICPFKLRPEIMQVAGDLFWWD